MVMAGYKQTEAGLVPVDWNDVRLGDFIGLRRGHDLTWRERRSGVIPVMGSAGQNGFHDTAIANGPGVVLGRSGASFGQAHYCEQAYWPHNTVLYVTDFYGNDPLFVFYFLKAIDFSRHNSGGAQESLNRNFINPIPIAIPNPDEQRAIASALSDVDGLLGALDRLIAKKRDLKQAAMQQLLTGQTRLSGFTGEWQEKTLHDTCQKIQDGTHFSPKLGGSDYLYITSKNIRFGRLDLSSAEYISKAEHDKIYSRCAVKPGDVLLTKDGANTGNAALNNIDAPFSLLSSVAMLRFSERHHSAPFFMYQILSEYGQAQIREAMSGNAITRLTLQKIRTFRFTVPSLAEQTAIAAILGDMDAELVALEQRLEKTHSIKQGMMQELLAGRTRLVNPDGSLKGEQACSTTA